MLDSCATYEQPVTIKVAPNGNLLMTASVEERRRLRRKRWLGTEKAEARWIRQVLPGYRQVRPEDVGALTSCALIEQDGQVWGDMDYQVRSFLETLSDGGTVRWTKG
jgi:hypothetical protein